MRGKFTGSRSTGLAIAIILGLATVPVSVGSTYADGRPDIVAEAQSFNLLTLSFRLRGLNRPRRRFDEIRAIVDRSARRHGVPPNLVLSIIRCESNFDTYAVSRAGARGLAQILPSTAAGEFGIVDADLLFVPEMNIDVSARYLRLLANRHRGRVTDVLVAYNAGSQRVFTQRVPMETRRYVRCVLRAWRHYDAILHRTPSDK